MSVKPLTRAAVAVTALGAIIAMGAVGGTLSSKRLSATTSLTPVNSTVLPASFSHIIEQVGPAVVSIRVTGRAKTAEAPQFEIPEPFRRFFGEEFGRHFDFGPRGDDDEARKRAPRVRGMGSGFFIDAEGHVVTNNHVVGDAEEIEIVLKDGETLKASLVGRDAKTDLALLKVDDKRTFPFVKFGDSAAAKVGDWVIAVGSPFGLGHTATTGIVSARGRDIGAGPYDDFLQIDAPINRGNSGGPAFNMRGEVIGVNTAILSPSGTNAGIGFAIPSNMAKNVIAQLKTSGAVERGWLGVHIQAVTPDIAAGVGLDEARGAIVAEVTAGGPADRAGLRQGDVIVGLNGEKIETMRELPRKVATLKAGEKAKISVLRQGSQRDVTVTIGKLPEGDKVAADTPPAKTDSGFGMSLAALDDRTRAQLRIDSSVDGVVVTGVEPDSVAARKGLRPGDVILQVGGEAVKAPRDVSQRLTAAKDSDRKAVLLLVHRRGDNRYVALPLRDA